MGMSSTDENVVGDAIARRRRQLCLTQSDLAVLTGVTAGTVGAWERGEQAVSEERAEAVEWALWWEGGAVSDIASGDGSGGGEPVGLMAAGRPERAGREEAWDAARRKRDKGWAAIQDARSPGRGKSA